MSKKIGLPEAIKMKHDYHLVDEISRRSKTPIVRNIPIEKLIPNEMQPRKDMGNLEELSQSIKEKGVIEPIIVKFKEEKFEIIAGERRYRAGLMAELKEIPCIEYDVPDNEALELSVIENLQRKDLSVYEESQAIKALNEIYGYTHLEIAQKIGKARVTITELIKLSELPDEIRNKCLELGITSKTFLLELAKIEDPEQMTQILEDYAEQSFSREVVKKIRREQNKEIKKRKIEKVKFKVISEDKSIKIKFDLNTEIKREALIEMLVKILEDIKENRIKELI